MKRSIGIGIIGILVLSITFVAIGQSREGNLFGLFNKDVQQEDINNTEAVSTTEDNSKAGDGTVSEETPEPNEDPRREKLIRTDQQGDVAVGVTFLNPIEEDEVYLNFEVILNTHSVELEQYNLAELTTINLGEAITIKEGIQWEVTEGGGHHLVGYLKVPTEIEGRKTDYKELDFIEIEIKELGETPSRVFMWKVEETKL